MEIKWRKWPDEKPERGITVIRVVGGQLNRNISGGWDPDEPIYWIYESDLLATLPKGEE